MTRARELARLGNTNVLTVDSNQNVGIGTLTPEVKLDVIGDAEISGVITATTFSGAVSGDATGLSGSASVNTTGIITAGSFYGDGQNLTGVAATDYVVANTLKVLGVSTFVGNAEFDGNISIGGTLTYEDVTNVDSVGVITARSGIRVGAGQSIGSTTSTENVVYYGDGSQLTGIAAGISTGAASGGQVTLDLTNQDHKVTASGVTTITCSGGTEGDSHTVRITNSGITTIGFSTYFLWPSGSAPSMPSASGTISLISFTIQRVGTAGTQLLAGASLDFS